MEESYPVIRLWQQRLLMQVLKPLFMIAGFTLLFYLFTGVYQTGDPAAAIKPSLLYGQWIHSFEDDKTIPAGKVYRPANFDFPPARGRDGFEIKQGGTFLSHPVALADGNTTVPEKWKLKGRELTVTGKNGIRKFTILLLGKDRMVLKPV